MAITRFPYNIKTAFHSSLAKYMATPKVYSAYLTDDGSDITLNENYAAAIDLYTPAVPQSVMITSLHMEVIDSDIAQNQLNNYEAKPGGTTQFTTGFNFRTVDSLGNNAAINICGGPINRTGHTARLVTIFRDSYNASSGTTANNWCTQASLINFVNLNGHGILVEKGGQFVCSTAPDNHTIFTILQFRVFGYYLAS